MALKDMVVCECLALLGRLALSSVSARSDRQVVERKGARVEKVSGRHRAPWGCRPRQSGSLGSAGKVKVSARNDLGGTRKGLERGLEC